MTTLVFRDARGNRYTLTCDHPRSTYAVPVLIDKDGSAFGPDDLIRDHHGDRMTAATFMKQLYLEDPKQQDCDLMRRWNQAALLP